MVSMQKVVAIGAGSVMALAAAAQVIVPPCCKYLWEWPPDRNPDGACSGNHSYTCQTGSSYVWGDDPLSDAKGPFIQAKCKEVFLFGNAQFLRVDCAEFPPPGKFIGVLPNGQCCYAVGSEIDIQVIETNAGYQIRRCEGNCDGSQS